MSKAPILGPGIRPSGQDMSHLMRIRSGRQTRDEDRMGADIKSASVSQPLRLFIVYAFGMVAIALSSWVGGATRAVHERVDIITASGRHEVLVEVARTASEQQQGLMFRSSIAADHGMLFVFAGEASIRMWMKNTYIPLDMPFISSKGNVVSIHENAKPWSESVISSGEPAHGVLEVAAGTVERIGLEKGSLIRHPAFVD